LIVASYHFLNHQLIFIKYYIDLKKTNLFGTIIGSTESQKVDAMGCIPFNKTFKTDEQWALKASRYFWLKLFTNKFVIYGLQYENIARDLYSKEFNTNILECALVIDVNNPWLSYSPDGVIIDEYFVPIKIIEIKCPFDGNKLGIKDLLII